MVSEPASSAANRRVAVSKRVSLEAKLRTESRAAVHNVERAAASFGASGAKAVNTADAAHAASFARDAASFAGNAGNGMEAVGEADLVDAASFVGNAGNARGGM